MLLGTGPDCLHAILLEHQGWVGPPGQATAFKVGLFITCMRCMRQCCANETTEVW
jgi:hypothetical protein